MSTQQPVSSSDSSDNNKSGSLSWIQIRPQVVATHGPLRQFLDRQHMLRRNAAGAAPTTDRSLGPKTKAANEGNLSTGGFGGAPQDYVEFAHAADSNAETATPVNANPATFGAQTGFMQGDNPKGFWRRLTEAWGEKGLPTTQLGIANHLHMSQGTTGRWARGVGLPELDLARVLARKGDICVEWLLTGRGPKRPMLIDEETNDLLDIWRKLNANGRHHVRTAAVGALAMQRAQTPLPTGSIHVIPLDEK